ncbi:MAG: LapA family protein [Deltaproteobacteria bacterium]|nr:LapA family protein [Deltaproteobacteria bacterium]
MKRAKMIGILVLALSVGIVVLQNTESVQTKILFFTFTMPRAVLLFLTALIGFIIGVLSFLHVGRKK